MTDPFESISAEAEAGASVGEPEASEGPSLGQRFGELFLPCPEDPMSHAGGVSQWVNGKLSERSGVPHEEIQVGENLAHCVNHLFPGGGTLGWPPIVNLARSVMAYRDKAAEYDPDNLVRR